MINATSTGATVNLATHITLLAFIFPVATEKQQRVEISSTKGTVSRVGVDSVDMSDTFCARASFSTLYKRQKLHSIVEFLFVFFSPPTMLSLS